MFPALGMTTYSSVCTSHKTVLAIGYHAIELKLK